MPPRSNNVLDLSRYRGTRKAKPQKRPFVKPSEKRAERQRKKLKVPAGTPQPEDLKEFLPQSIDAKIFRFGSEKQMQAYRSRLYQLNHDNDTFRFCTKRYGRLHLLIWRMDKEYDLL